MVRIARIGIGLVLLVLGLFLLVLPGPGILTIAGGLAILATEFTWARRLLDWMKDRFRQYFTRDEEPAASDGAPVAGAPRNGPTASEGETTTPD